MTAVAGVVAVIGALVLAILSPSISAEYLEPNCGIRDDPVGPRIFNGTAAKINFYPWMAYLYTSIRFVCGGTLIHPRFILTAAHCVEERLKARLGEYDFMTRKDCTVHGCSPRAEEHDIDMALRHGGFSFQTGANDIALLRMSRSVEYNVHIKPICIILDPLERPNLPYLKRFVATGWGNTRTNRTRGSLQEVTLRRFAAERCETILTKTVQEDQFCAGSPYGDTCHGDSGGPLGQSLTHNGQTRFVQLGVVSYGSPNCSGIGVYSDVVFHAPWIQHTVQKYKDLAQK